MHLIHGMVPNLPANYIIGHEPMGIVEEAGPAVTKSSVMGGLVKDEELRALMNQDLIASQEHIKELQNLIQSSAFAELSRYGI